MKKWATERGLELNNDLVQKNTELIQAVYDDLMKLASSNKFNSLEKPKQIMLFLDPWTEHNDFLTPTMKMKRSVAKDLLANEIADLYSRKTLAPSKK